MDKYSVRGTVRLLDGSSKFDSRRTALLYVVSLDGGCDREVGTTDDIGWHGRIGKFVVREDGNGFVDHLGFATDADAERYLDALEDEGEDLSGYEGGERGLRVSE